MHDTEYTICGIDPGLRRTGYGVIRVDERDDSLELIDAGVVRCSEREPLALRLAELAAGLDEILDEHRPQAVAVEEIYSHYRQPRTAILMAHARGVILLEAARRNLRVLHLPATSVKRHITGSGRASKEQIQRAIADTFQLPSVPEPPDVADALAIALSAIGMLQRPGKDAGLSENLFVEPEAR